MTARTWIVIANASRARVFEAAGAGRPLRELEGFVHERSRVKGSDILCDRPGRVRPGLVSGPEVTAMPPHTDPRETEAVRFAHELAEEMRHAHERGRYKQFVMAAPPHFLGLLRASVKERLGNSLVASIDKDYTLLNEPDLRARLMETLRDAGRAESQRLMS